MGLKAVCAHLLDTEHVLSLHAWSVTSARPVSCVAQLALQCMISSVWCG